MNKKRTRCLTLVIVLVDDIPRVAAVSTIRKKIFQAVATECTMVMLRISRHKRHNPTVTRYRSNFRTERRILNGRATC
ncbi:hypothetical protein F5Y05DRAFT_289718 [Hypoxylon sp. FL0543]|nr:hypothetical protein F5Y05DRAFT_289718 [Hypoxylon sp. FL0543]